MRTKWTWVLGLAIAVFALGGVAKADHLRGYYGGYGYGVPGSYGYSAPGYGYGSGFYNQTDQYHYTHPRVTTGYGYQSYSTYRAPRYDYGYRRGGSVNVRYPGGGVDVGWGRRGGAVQVYRGYRGISIGW